MNILKKWWFWLIVVLVIGGVVFVVWELRSKSTGTPTSTTQGSGSTDTSGSSTATSADPAVKDGQQLSDNKCTGTGTVPLTSAPMKTSDISIIEPYGLTVGGHVTPVDHEYYWAKNNTKDANVVLAPGTGHMVDFEYRSHNGQGPIPGDYRVVISYSCTFFSYFDLATSLDPAIASQLPSGWEQHGSTSANIAVTAGQTIAKMGGQSLDFAVWDTTKTNAKLLVPAAYTGEAWKIHTVAPLDYFSTAVGDSIKPYYVRQAAPIDGTYAYDVAGKLIGSWFLKGSGGYSGASGNNSGNYWTGHLAIAPDFIDPAKFGFSIGDYQGQATQFVIAPPVTDPATVGVDTGLVKYQLLHIGRYLQPNGQEWDGLSTPSALPLSLPTNGAPTATALVQLTDDNTLKVEVFAGKTPAQVSAFDSSAKTYTRSGN